MAFNSTIDQIKERLSIVDVVGSYIKVEKAGKNFKALSPFSNEKTPSFYISTDQNLYHCFSTGKGGDIFTFVQEMEGVDFKEALSILAERAGVPIKYESKENESNKKRLEKILEVSTIYYQKQLEKNKNAKDYLKSRGLNEETIVKWRLGVAPSSWNMLLDFFLKKKVSKKELEEVGLIKKGDKGSYYDRFRNRIMFPIFNPNSKVVAYSGRRLSDQSDEAKYINSPETIFFSKSNILYGYNMAKAGIRKFNFSILVEGQMDVLMAHQEGYTNTVASSGTALTEYQLKLLRRLSDRLVIALDGDSAGLRASEKAFKLAIELGIDVKIAVMPTGQDPADLIKSNPKKWKEVIKNAKHIIEVLANNIYKEEDERKRMKRISTELIPYLNSFKSKLEQSYFVKLIANKFDLKEEHIWSEVSDKPSVVEIPKQLEEESDPLKHIIALCIWQENVSKSDKVLSLKDNLKKLLENNFQSVYSSVENDKSLLSKTEMFYEKTDVGDELIGDMVQRVENMILSKERDTLKKKLKEAEEKKDFKEADIILSKIQEISKKIL